MNYNVRYLPSPVKHDRSESSESNSRLIQQNLPVANQGRLGKVLRLPVSTNMFLIFYMYSAGRLDGHLLPHEMVPDVNSMCSVRLVQVRLSARLMAPSLASKIVMANVLRRGWMKSCHLSQCNALTLGRTQLQPVLMLSTAEQKHYTCIHDRPTRYKPLSCLLSA